MKDLREQLRRRHIDRGYFGDLSRRKSDKAEAEASGLGLVTAELTPISKSRMFPELISPNLIGDEVNLVKRAGAKKVTLVLLGFRALAMVELEPWLKVGILFVISISLTLVSLSWASFHLSQKSRHLK